MRPIVDLTGMKFGRLTVLHQQGVSKNRNAIWLCKCDCGNEKLVLSANLKRGSSKSCGCLRFELNSSRKTIHGCAKDASVTPEYRAWSALKNRCTNKKNKSYYQYGGRGIKVCQRWIESYENFIEDMGQRPSSLHSIDRINVNGNYEPSNCVWATPKEQARNRRVSKSSKTGHPGVCWVKRQKKWKATISRKVLGVFEQIEDAIKAREQAEIQYWGKSS